MISKFRLPVTQQLLQARAQCAAVNLADHRQLRCRGTEKVGMKPTHLRQLQILHCLDLLVKTGHVTNVTGRIRVQPLRQHVVAECHRIVARLGQLVQPFLLQLGKFRRRQRWLAQHFRQQCQCCIQIAAPHLQQQAQPLCVAVNAQIGAQLIQRLRQLAPVLALRATLQHAYCRLASGGLPLQAVDVAKMQLQRQRDLIATIAFGQQRQLQATGQAAALDACLDIGRAWVERLAQCWRGLAGIVLQHRRRIAARRDIGTLRCVVGNKMAQRAIARQQISLRHPLQIGHLQRFDPIPFEIEQAPVTARHIVREIQRQIGRVGDNLLKLVEPGGARGVEFLLCNRLRRHAFQHLQHGLAQLAGIGITAGLGGKRDIGRIKQGVMQRGNLASEAGFHQLPVQTAIRRATQYLQQ